MPVSRGGGGASVEQVCISETGIVLLVIPLGANLEKAMSKEEKKGNPTRTHTQPHPPPHTHTHARALCALTHSILWA